MDVTQMEGVSGGKGGAGGGGSGGGFTSNLTTMEQSLRSSYADIAFGRNSPCPPGNLPEDGGRDAEEQFTRLENPLLVQQQQQPRGEEVFTAETVESGNAEQYRPSRPVRQNKQQQYLQESQKFGKSQQQPVSAYAGESEKGRPTARRKRRPYEGSKSARGLLLRDTPRGERQKYEAGSGSGAGAGYSGAPERPASCSPTRRVKGQPESGSCTVVVTGDRGEPMPRPSSVDLIAMDDSAIGMSKLESSRSISSSLWSNDGRCPSYAEVFFGAGGGQHSTSRSLDSLSNVEQMPEDNVPVQMVSPSEEDRQGFEPTADLLKQQVQEIVSFVEEASSQLQRDEQEMRGLEQQQQQYEQPQQIHQMSQVCPMELEREISHFAPTGVHHQQQQQMDMHIMQEPIMQSQQQQPLQSHHSYEMHMDSLMHEYRDNREEEMQNLAAAQVVYEQQQQQRQSTPPQFHEQRQSTPPQPPQRQHSPPQPPQRQHSPPQQQQQQQQYQASAPPQEDSGSKLSYASILAVNMPEKPLEMEEQSPSHGSSRRKRAPSPPLYSEGHSEPIILLPGSEPGAQDTEGDARESTLESEIAFKHPTIPGLIFKKESANLLAPSPMPRRRRRRSGRSRSKSLHTSEADDDSDDEDKQESAEQNLQSQGDSELQAAGASSKPTRPSRKRKPHKAKQLHKAVSEPDIPKSPMHHHQYSHEPPTHDDDIEIPDELAYGDGDNDDISESQSRSCDVGYVSGPTTQASEDRARSETPSEITKEGFADAETDAAPISEAGTSSHQKAKKKKKPKKKPHEEEDEIERALRDIEQMEKAKKQPHKGISLDTAPSFDDSEMSYGKVEMSGESAAAPAPTEAIEQSPRPERRQRKGKNKLQQQQQRQDTLEETGGSSLDLAGGEQAVVEHVDVLSEALLETYEKLDSGAATVRDPADIPVALELVEGEQKKEGNEEQGGDAPVATKRTKKNKKGEKKQGKGKQDEQVAQQTDTDGQAPKEEKLEGDEMAVKVEKQLVESVDNVSENNGSAPLITPVVVEGDINTSIGTDVTTATTCVAADATGEPEIGYLLSKSERLDEFPMTVISPEPQKEVVIEPEHQQQQKMEASVNEKESSAPLVFNAPEETSNQQKDEQEKQQQQKPPKRKKRKAKKSESESIDESGPSEVETQVQQESALPHIEKPVEIVQEQQPPPQVEKLVEIESEQPKPQVEKVAEQFAAPTEKLVETVPPVEQPKPFALVKKEDELWDAWMDDDVCPIEDDFEDSTPVIQPITTTETVQVAPVPKVSVQPVQEQKQQEPEKVGEVAITQPTFGLLKTTDPFDDFWMNDEPCPIEDDVEDQIVDPMAEQMKLFAPDSVKDEKTDAKDKEEEKQAIITPVKSEETPKKEEKAGGFNLLKSSDPWDDLWMDDEPCPIIDDEEEQQQQNGAQIEAASSLESQPASNKASQVDAQQRETGEGEEIQSGLIPAATPAITPTVEETTPKGITTESQEGEQMAVATSTTAAAAAIDDQSDQKARSKENKKKGGSGTKGGKSGESKVEKQDAHAEVTHPSESKSGSKGSSKKWSGGSKQKQKGMPKSATDWKTKGKGEEGLSGQEQESAGEWETVAEEIVEPTTATTPASEGAVLEESSNNVSVVPHMEVVETLLQTAAEEAVEFTVQQKDEEIVLGDNSSPVLQGEEATEAEEIKPGKPIKRRDTKKKLKRPAFVGSEAQEKIAPEGESSRELIELSESSAAVISTEPQTEIAIKQEDIDQTAVAGSEVEKKGGEQEGNKIIDDDRTTEMASRIIDEGQSKQDEQAKQQSIEEDLGRETGKKATAIEKEKAQSEVEGDNSSNKKGKGGKKGGENKGKKGGKGKEKMEETEAEVGQTQAPGSKRPQPPQRRRTKSKNSDSESEIVEQSSPVMPQKESQIEAIEEISGQELQFASEPAIGKGKQKRKRTKSKNSESEDAPESTKAVEQETEAVVATATEPVAEEVLKPVTVEESAAGALPDLEFSMEPAAGKGKQRRRRTKSKNSESEDQPEAQLPIEQASEVVKTEKIAESATIPEAKAEEAADELDFAMEPAKGKGKQKRKRTKSKNSESEDSPVAEQVPQPEKQESLSSPPTSLTTTEEFTSITSTTTTTEPESELPFEPVQKGKGKQQRKQKKEKPQNQKSRNSESESDNQSTSQEIKAEVAPVQESIPEAATAQEAHIAPKPEPAKPKETKKQQQQQKRKQARSKNSESEEAAPVTSTTTTATEAQAEVATLELASTPKEHKQVEQSPLISLEETQPSQEKTESSSKEDEKEKVVAAGEPESGETARRNKAKQKRKRNQTRNSECEPEEGAESGSVVPGKSPETEEKSQLAEQTSTVSLSSSSEQPSEAKQEQKESKAEEPSSSSPASAAAPLSTCAKKEKSQQGNKKKGSSTPTFKERKASDSSRSQSFSVTEEPSHDEQQEKSERSHSVSEVALSAATVVLAAAAGAAIPTTGDETTTATESKVISQVEDKQEAINKSEQNDSEVISQKVEPAVVEVVVDVQQTIQPEPVKQTDYKLKTDDVFGDAWMDDDVCPVADDDEEDATNEVQQPKEESVLTTTAVEKVEATVEVKEPKKSEVAPVAATEQKPVSFALKTDDIFGDAWMDDEAMVIDVSDGDEEVTKSPEKSAVTSTVEVEIVSAPNKLEETTEPKPEQVSEKEEKKEEKRVRFPPDEELSEEKLINTKEGKGGKKKRRKPQKSKAAEEAEKTLAGLESGHSSQDETSALSHDESQTDPESGVGDDGFMVFQSRKTKLKGKRAQDEDEEDKKEDEDEKKAEVEEEVTTSVAPLATPESPEKVAEVVEAVVTSSSPAEEQKEEIAVVSIDTVALASEEPTLTHAAQDMEALLAGEVDSLQLSSIETLPDSQEDKEEPEASVSFAKDVTIIQYDDEAEPSTVTFATLREYSRRSSLPDEGKDVKAPPQMQESPSLDESPPETPVEPQAVSLEVKPAEQIKEQSVVATGENVVEVEIKEQPKAKEEEQSPEVTTEEKRENSAIQPTTLHAMSSQIISQLDFQEAESRWHAYITQQRNRQQKSDAPPQEIGGQEEKPIAKPLENVTNAIKLENEAKSAKSTTEAPVPEPSAEVKEVEETPVAEPAVVTEVIPDVSTSRKPVVVETHQKTPSSNKPLSYAQVAASPQKVQKQPSLTENLEALLETARITQYLVFQEAERTYQEYRAQQPSPPPATPQEEEQKDETTAEGNVPSVPENEPVSPPKADVEVSSSNKSRPLVEAAQEVSKMVEQLASEIKALSTPPPEPSQEYLEPKAVTATPPPSPEPPAAAPSKEPSSSTTTAAEPTSPQLNDSQQDPFLLQMVSFNEAERKWREGLDKQKQQQEEPEASSSKHPPGSDDPDGSNNQDPPPSDGGGDRGRRGNKPPVTELLLGGLSNLSCNWLDWSTYLSPEIKLPGKLAFPSPTSAGGAPVFPTPQVEEVDVSTGATSPATEETRVEQQEGRVDADDLKKIKEESQADVDELGKAINAAAEKLSNLDPEQLEQTLHKTWELLGGLKDLEGSGLTLKDNVDSNFPAEDPDAKTMSTELKELLSRLVVLMAQTEKLNKATKVNESVDKEQQGRTSCPYLNIASSPSHPLSDDENGRRSPEGSCASAGLTMLTPTSGVSATTLMKSPSGSRLIETGESSQKWFTNENTPGNNGKSGSGCHGNQGQFLAHQCGCCGAPILISILSPNDFPQREQQQQYLLRENFYRLNQTSTTAGHQFHHNNNNNQYHHLQQDGVFH